MRAGILALRFSYVQATAISLLSQGYAGATTTMGPPSNCDVHLAISHNVDFYEIAAKLVRFLTQQGAFGWLVKYIVGQERISTWFCPCCLSRNDNESARHTSPSFCEFCGTVWRLSEASKDIRKVVVANGVAPPRWWREWTPEKRCRMGAQAWWRYGGGFERLWATLDHSGRSGYEPHSSESESDSDDKDGYHV